MNTLAATVIQHPQQINHHTLPHGFWHLAPDVWTAIGTLALVGVGIATAVVAGVAAWIAYHAAKEQIRSARDQLLQAQAESDRSLQTATAQLEQARKAAEAQLEEAQRLRREQIQPYVAVFTESSGNHPAQVDLVIKNFGMTPARDIEIEFTPEPRSANLRNSDAEKYLRVPDVIALLVPNQEWRTYWDWGAALEEAKDLPRRYDVKVRYSDQHGNKIEPASKFVIDWEILFAQSPINVNSPHDAAGALMGIRDAIQSVTSGGSVTVQSFDGEEQQKRSDRNRRKRLRRWRVAGNSADPATVADRVLVRVERLNRAARKRLGF